MDRVRDLFLIGCCTGLRFSDLSLLSSDNIDKPILLQRTKGTLTYAETKPKYDLVTSHTARRSFATNAYLAGLPPISIMKITGHKTESSFMKYIKISEKENAIQLKGHEFFNQIVTC